MTTTRHQHTIHCATRTVTTTDGAWTTQSVEFACDEPALEAVMDLEVEVRRAGVSVAFAPASLPEYLHQARITALAAAKDRLFAAVSALTPEQAAAYGTYRLTH